MPPLTTADDAPAIAGSPLLRRLVDDAAVFPPAALTLADAVREHALHREAWYAPCVGPLLVPAAATADLVAVLDARDAAVPTGQDAGRPPLAVALVARPGADPATTTAALDALRDEVRVQVVGAELAWQEDWRDLGLDDLPLALEVPRGGTTQEQALADIRAGVGEGRPVVAKFRTGPTPAWPWPDDAELAGFIMAASRVDAPFKLTGGLHHAARGRYEVAGEPEENHGVLNVLLATAAAVEGAGVDEVTALLGLRDAEALAGLVAAWPDATATAVRTAFTAFGCCTVTDPLGELADLGLLTRP